ncbi:MAG: tungstate ABC transporter substrate-binding protein WtpA [Candidatus Omnitrophica bacterium]|nr:tungstate ABC transporter substrate-binding protein WtpA [Candidatus Omnitrophota bacterium]MBU1923857.1 tungstate ABC transporter substrate-binding protein WtpA [Candidatus Omnitrophota bacterium]
MIKLNKVLLLFLLLTFISRVNPGQSLDEVDFNKTINVSFAAGLNSSVNQIISEFKKIHPKAKFIRESGGTLLLIRKITELNQAPDVIFVADALAIKDKLIPEYADWYLKFYKDRIVIAYSDKSKYTNEINNRNWYRVLLRKDVRFGYANPNLAPVGYRTLMSWQLADLYYKTRIDNKSIYDSLKGSCPIENIMPDVAELLRLLESLSLDYAFVYESTAKQHNLKYIQLPKEIDLGSDELSEFYKQAKVEISNKKNAQKEILVGAPITFGLTILKDAANTKGAIEFIKFFLGPEGRKVLNSNYQAMLSSPLAYNAKSVPDELKQFVLPEDIASK